MISPLPKGSWRNLGGPAAHRAREPGGWESVNAIDLGAPVGTPVFAVADGVIDPSKGFGFSSGARTWGYRLTLARDLGPPCFYTHMGGLAKGIAPGARVREGQRLGWIGRMPGYPPHLHFAVEPPGDPTLIAYLPPVPRTPEEKLRARTGFYAWANWLLGRGRWKPYGKANPKVRPDVPARIPRRWWRRLAMMLRRRP